MERELEDRGRALSGDDGRVGEEEHPNTIPDNRFLTPLHVAPRLGPRKVIVSLHVVEPTVE